MASITSRKRSGAISTIFATSFLPEATTRMSTRPKRSLTRLRRSSRRPPRRRARLLTRFDFGADARGMLTAISSSSLALPAVSTSLAPAAARTSAAKAPKAPEAPVTMATLPSRRRARADWREPGSWLHSRRIGNDDQHLADVDWLRLTISRTSPGAIVQESIGPEHRLLAADDDGHLRRRERHRLSRTASNPARRRRPAEIANSRPTGWWGRPARSPAGAARRRPDDWAPHRAWRRRSA